MKYCKKCFRNVREDVSICPYCGAPGLEEYGSHNSGEDFSCTQPKNIERNIRDEIKGLSPNEDVYNQTDDDIFGMLDEKTDAYGNLKNKNACNDTESDAYGSKIHNDDCDNAPDTPNGQGSARKYQPKSFSPDEMYGYDNDNDLDLDNSETDIKPEDNQDKVRIEYANMLKRVYGAPKDPDNDIMDQLDILKMPIFTPKISMPKKAEADKNSLAPSALMSQAIGGIFVGFLMPVIGIIVLLVVKKNLNRLEESKATNNLNKLIKVFLVVFIAMVIMQISSAGILGLFTAFGGAMNV